MGGGDNGVAYRTQGVARGSIQQICYLSSWCSIRGMQPFYMLLIRSAFSLGPRPKTIVIPKALDEVWGQARAICIDNFKLYTHGRVFKIMAETITLTVVGSFPKQEGTFSVKDLKTRKLKSKHCSCKRNKHQLTLIICLNCTSPSGLPNS